MSPKKEAPLVRRELEEVLSWCRTRSCTKFAGIGLQLHYVEDHTGAGAALGRQIAVPEEWAQSMAGSLTRLSARVARGIRGGGVRG
jgi:hypothetical protein